MTLIIYKPEKKRFSEREVCFIKTHYPVRSASWIADQLGKTQEQIKQFCSRHKIYRATYKISTDKVRMIRELVGMMPIADIAERIGEAKIKVASYIYRNHLVPNPYRSYTKAEIKFLQDNYHNLSNTEIASAIGRTHNSVHHKVAVLKLKRTAQDLVNLKKRLCSETFYSKGHLPKNTKYDGYISIRKDSNGIKYKHIRTALGKFDLLHRHNWIQKNGRIPNGKILRCKDGDQLNCDPENWYITDRAEHLGKNSGRTELTDNYIIAKISHRKPELEEQIRNMPGLLELKRNQLKLRRTINELTQITSNEG